MCLPFKHLNLRSVGSVLVWFGFFWFLFGFVFDSFYRASGQKDLQQSGWKKDILKFVKDVKNESLTELV